MSSLSEGAISSEILSRHYSGSHHKLNEFRHNGKYCVITVRVRDTSAVRCHRAVLASVSESFDVMFFSTIRQSDEEEIVLSEVDPSAFESVLQFAYLG